MDIYLGMGLLGYRIILYLAFWWTVKLFSKVTEILHFIFLSAVRVQFLHIITNSCFLIKAILLGLKWYLMLSSFLFLWSLMMLSIFSSAYQWFVYLLWRNVYSDSSTIFNWVVSLFIVELQEFSIVYLKSFIRDTIQNHFSSCAYCLFTVLMKSSGP